MDRELADFTDNETMPWMRQRGRRALGRIFLACLTGAGCTPLATTARPLPVAKTTPAPAPHTPPPSSPLADRILEEVIPAPEHPIAWVVLSEAQTWSADVQLQVPRRVVADLDREIVVVPALGGGIEALDIGSGALRWASKEAALPLVAHQGRILAAAPPSPGAEPSDMIWLDSASGHPLGRPTPSGTGELWACPSVAPSPSSFCFSDLRGHATTSDAYVALGMRSCSWFDGGAATESRWICSRASELREVTETEIRATALQTLPGDEPPAVQGVFRFDGARLDIRAAESGFYELHHVDAQGADTPVEATWERSSRSADGRFLGLGVLASEVADHHGGKAHFYRWRVVDIVTGRASVAAFRTFAPEARFFVRGEVVVSIDDGALSGSSLSDGRTRWVRTLPPARPAPQPPVAPRDALTPPPQ